jgi:hypothetical protein
MMLLVPGLGGCEIALERIHDLVVLAKVKIIASRFFQAAIVHIQQKSHRVMGYLFPECVIDLRKKLLRIRVPNPPQVVGELPEPFYTGWKFELLRWFYLIILHRLVPLAYRHKKYRPGPHPKGEGYPKAAGVVTPEFSNRGKYTILIIIDL